MGRSSTLREALRVAPGSRVDLTALDPRDTHGISKSDAVDELEATRERLAGLQERLWAEDRQRILVVLQGMDTSGKGGTIEHVMGGLNPAGVVVTSFKVPTPVELAHDYLWRVHARVPQNGQVGIFDRSHYEDVLVVRVHELVPKKTWSRRFEQINAFERLLSEEGTTIIKCYLHISPEEQAERLQARLDDPTKRWKFRMGDLETRKRWDDFRAAYEDVLNRCSTSWAPWYVIPADRKWFRNLAVSRILLETLEELDPQYPPAAEDVPADLRIV